MTNKPMLSVERDLRAILDMAVECLCRRYGKDNPHWPCPIHSQPSAQHQGEPVAKLGVHHVLGAIHKVPGFPGVKGTHIHDLTALLNGVLNGIEKPTIGLTSCEHEWLDDGQFLQMCPACGMTEDYTKAFELAFNHGGTDEGNYFLDEEELLEVIRCHVDQLGISNQISKSDKTKAELYDEVWKLAREMGYNNVTDALSVTPKKV